VRWLFAAVLAAVGASRKELSSTGRSPMAGSRSRWAAGLRLGPSTPPGLHLADLGLLLGEPLLGQFADLGQAALSGFGGGELTASPVPGRHHLKEGHIEPGAANSGQAGKIGFLAAAGLLLGGS
jgi:hypothetical protein